MIIDRDNTTDKWECPHCGHPNAYIIEEAVLKNDWKEIMCGCLECNEMYIREYKFVKIIKLIRE